jgi:hypothetical protein
VGRLHKIELEALELGLEEATLKPEDEIRCIECEDEAEMLDVATVVEKDEVTIFEPLEGFGLGPVELELEDMTCCIELEDEIKTLAGVRVWSEDETCCIEVEDGTKTLIVVELSDKTCCIELEDETGSIEVED